MSIRLIAHAIDMTLPPSEKLVLILLANNADDTAGEAYPSQDYLAKKSGFSRETVNRVIQRLVHRGLVEIKHQFNASGRQKNSLYTVLRCDRRSHTGVTHDHTEPSVRNHSLITPSSLGKKSHGKTYSNRKLSAVERAAQATARIDARIEAERAAATGDCPPVAEDGGDIRPPVDKRLR